MAPALTLTPREPPDAVLDVDNTFTIRRRALASVDNLSTHMEEDDMGLQNTPSLVKDSQEMEQILVDLGSSDLAQADLLQAIKTLESGGDVLSTGDADVIFPGFDLAEAVDSEGDAAEDKIRLMQARLERRCAFLQRRLRILQARAIGKRVSEEAAVTFEKCIRGARKDGGGRPMGLKALLKKVETTAALQASASSRNTVGPSYFNAGSSKGDASKSASIGIPAGTLAGLEGTAGALRSHLSVVKHELDSDATASSSGAESNDEAVNYNNPHQQPMPIEKRALWTWQRARASIASRWTWLQAQVQELEYKIRQHNDLHNQVREAKGPVQFVGEPAAYQGSLPGSNIPEDDSSWETCARVRPLDRETFKKRKLLLMHNLHIATSKAAKPTDILCSCQHPVESCPVCVGRADPRLPLPPFSTLSPMQKVALVDPSFHPVLSETRDISPAVHLAALSSRGWLRARVSKPARGGHHAPPARAKPAPHPPHPQPPIAKLKRGRPPLTRKVRDKEHGKEKEKEEDTASTVAPAPTATTASESSGRRGRASTESRRRASYDIDNIVIPQSVAANTRPMILSYKEIDTPKWRVMEIPRANLNNGVSKMSRRISMDSDEEDISDEAILSRHIRAEHRERNRYVRKQRARRAQQEAPLDPLAPPSLPALPAPPPVAPPPVAPSPSQEAAEVIRPYSPRQFPLLEETYATMLSAMPDGYYPSSPEPTIPVPSPLLEDDERTSTISSPLSPLIFEGDDPDDVEWDPSSEKAERRKSGFR